MRSKLSLSYLLTNLYRWLLRCILFVYLGLLHCGKWFPKKTRVDKKLTILVTGTFYSDNWLITHLKPMANAENCQTVIMVSTTTVPEINNVVGVYPPKVLVRFLGSVPARLMYFSWLAISKRPDVLVGFHLLINGLFVALLARFIGAKSVYICGGGELEVIGGGVHTENRIFSRIGREDKVIEGFLLRAVNAMDLVVSMGHGAVNYFKINGVLADFSIVPGGFDSELFMPDESINKKYDFILVGRLSNVKRVDRFLQALREAKIKLPHLKAVIVGDGPDRQKLELLAVELGVDCDVHFAGWQDNVEEWLQSSKCFVLTSDSEGLSQALIQAMMIGVPAIVSDVGDLKDLVVSDSNGYLISELDVGSFADAFINFFSDETKQKSFSKHALESTKQYTVNAVSKQWTKIFASFYFKY